MRLNIPQNLYENILLNLPKNLADELQEWRKKETEKDTNRAHSRRHADCHADEKRSHADGHADNPKNGEICEKTAVRTGEKKGEGGFYLNLNSSTSTPNDTVTTSNDNKEKKYKKRKRDFQLSQEMQILFDKFWEAYPRKKVGKSEAEFAFQKAFDTNEGLTIETLLKAIAMHSQAYQWLTCDIKWIPHPTSFLNQKKWQDELQTTPSQAQPSQPAAKPKPKLASWDRDGWLDTEGNFYKWGENGLPKGWPKSTIYEYSIEGWRDPFGKLCAWPEGQIPNFFLKRLQAKSLGANNG